MSGKAALEKKLGQLMALRDSPADAEKELRRALQDKNGFFVSKAAALASEMHLTALLPDLEKAFERFLIDPVKTDPQCWAKLAIVKALRAWEHKEPQIFLRGLSHVQREPVWGGEADTAGPLRGACAMALVQCSLSDLEILKHLTAGLADPEKTVRLDTASAIGALGSETGGLLLRLKALLGDRESEVTGQCFVSLLDLAHPDDVEFVAGFLNRSHGEEIQAEAISALAQAKTTRALDLLRETWKGRLSTELRRTLILSLAGSPLPASGNFLVSLLREESDEIGEWVIEALGASRFRGQVEGEVRSLVEQRDNPRLNNALAERFS